MATRKITVTVEDDALRQIRALVVAGQASSVSGFVKHAIGIALFDAAGWRQMLRDACRRPEVHSLRTSGNGRMRSYPRGRPGGPQRREKRRERHAADAVAVGLLLASSGTSHIVDAHVVVCAKRATQDRCHGRFRRPEANRPRLAIAHSLSVTPVRNHRLTEYRVSQVQLYASIADAQGVVPIGNAASGKPRSHRLKIP